MNGISKTNVSICVQHTDLYRLAFLNPILKSLIIRKPSVLVFTEVSMCGSHVFKPEVIKTYVRYGYSHDCTFLLKLNF